MRVDTCAAVDEWLTQAPGKVHRARVAGRVGRSCFQAFGLEQDLLAILARLQLGGEAVALLAVANDATEGAIELRPLRQAADDHADSRRQRRRARGGLHLK